MRDKPVAALAAVLVVAPICAVCLLGPAIFGAVIAGLGGWLSGNGPLTVAGVAILGGIGALALRYRRRQRAAAQKATDNAAASRWEHVSE